MGLYKEIIDYKEPEHVAQPYIQSIVNELIGKEKSPRDFTINIFLGISSICCQGWKPYDRNIHYGCYMDSSTIDR